MRLLPAPRCRRPVAPRPPHGSPLRRPRSRVQVHGGTGVPRRRSRSQARGRGSRVGRGVSKRHVIVMVPQRCFEAKQVCYGLLTSHFDSVNLHFPVHLLPPLSPHVSPYLSSHFSGFSGEFFRFFKYQVPLFIESVAICVLCRWVLQASSDAGYIRKRCNRLSVSHGSHRLFVSWLLRQL